MSGQIRVREYGTAGSVVIVLHGGPAATGNARGLAIGLQDEFRVYEPWQRGSGDETLTVARHVADLHELVVSLPAGKPAVVGESWGAMLALAYAAEHPDTTVPLALVGCGTFDPESRARLQAIRAERQTNEMREKIKRLADDITDQGELFCRQYEICERIDYYEPIHDDEPDTELPSFDMQAHTETWEDMKRLQAEGVYPAAFSAIKGPVIMLHGVYDPHPGRMIYENLKPYMPQLEYHEWERCGHSPWIEKHVREDFFRVLRRWLSAATRQSR